MNAMIPEAGISSAQMFVIIFSGTFGLMGVTFLAVGLAFNASMSRKRSLCTAYTEGTVGAMQSQFGSTGLCAVYSFTIGGKPLQYVSNYAGGSGLLVGQSVGVYYDPQNIGCVYIEEEARQAKGVNRVFTILGAMFLSVALIAAVLLGVW